MGLSLAFFPQCSAVSDLSNEGPALPPPSNDQHSYQETDFNAMHRVNLLQFFSNVRIVPSMSTTVPFAKTSALKRA